MNLGVKTGSKSVLKILVPTPAIIPTFRFSATGVLDHYFSAIFSPPQYVWFWVAFGSARQFHCPSFGNHLITRSVFVDYVWWYHNVQISHLKRTRTNSITYETSYQSFRYFIRLIRTRFKEPDSTNWNPVECNKLDTINWEAKRFKK